MLYAWDTHVNMVDGVCHFLESTPPSPRLKIIYLPSRRACRHVQKKLQHRRYPLHKLTLCALNQNDILYKTHTHYLNQKPKHISVLSRVEYLYIVARLIKTLWHENVSMTQAFHMAKAIRPTLDVLRTYDVAVEAIEHALRTDEALGASPFYIQTLTSLIRIMQHEPDMCVAFGKYDAASLHRLAYNSIYDFWAHNHTAQTHDIVIAGVNQYHPVSAEFLKRAAAYHHTILFPMCDTAALMQPEITPTSMHAPLYKLVRAAHIDPARIQPLSIPHQPIQYQSYISESPLAYVLDVRRIIQRALTDGHTQITVITPCRLFARRLRAELKLHAIAVNDSTATPLAQTAFGCMVQAVLDFFKTGHVSHFLALLKQPAVSYPILNPIPFAPVLRVDVYAFERALRMTPHLSSHRPSYAPFIACLQREGDITLAHIQSAVRILMGEGESDLEPAYTQFWTDVHELSQSFPPSSHDKSFHHLYTCIQHVLEYTTHSDPAPDDTHIVTLIGAMEGRVEHADLVIMTHLEEGVFPRSVAPNVFMSPRMERALGLPTREDMQALQAQDFFQCLTSAPHVILSYCKHNGHDVTRPSPFWHAAHANATITPYTPCDGPVTVPRDVCIKPCVPPRVAVDQRPKRLSISAVQCLMNDAYAFYVKYIVRLKPLWPLCPPRTAFYRYTDQENGRSLVFGQRLHAGLEHYVKNTSCRDIFKPQDRVNLMQHLMRAFDGFDLSPVAMSRLHGLAQFLCHQPVRDHQPTRIQVEHKHTRTVNIKDTIFTIYGTADRMDTYPDGCVIMDYKTGEPPSYTSVQKGLSPQLPVIAWLHHMDAVELMYIHVMGKEPFGCYVPLKNSKDLIDAVMDHVTARLTDYINPDFTFTHNPDSWMYKEYKNLGRFT